MRTLLLCSLLGVAVSLELMTIGIIGATVTAISSYFYLEPSAYYKGNLEVCVGGSGNRVASPFMGLTTCAKPSFRISLNQKVHFKENIDGTTLDGKRVRVAVDSILFSPNLEEFQERLVEEFYVNDVPFQDSIINVPIRNCLQNYISQTSSETMKADKTPNLTYQEVIRVCMEEYETTYQPMKYTFALVRQ